MRLCSSSCHFRCSGPSCPILHSWSLRAHSHTFRPPSSPRCSLCQGIYCLLCRGIGGQSAVVPGAVPLHAMTDAAMISSGMGFALWSSSPCPLPGHLSCTVRLALSISWTPCTGRISPFPRGILQLSLPMASCVPQASGMSLSVSSTASTWYLQGVPRVSPVVCS